MRPVSLLIAFAVSCAPGQPDDPFLDRGEGIWHAMPDVPDLPYRAIWGASASDVYAVGDGGVSHLRAGGWQQVKEVPVANYRAVWGRSSLEVWIGGDNVLLARSLDGWQQQTLWHDGLPIEEFSVLALFGSASAEYAIIFTGGKQLIAKNRGSRWEPLSVSGHPLPLWPTAIVFRGHFVVAGVGDLVDVRYVSWHWEGLRWQQWHGIELDQASLTGIAQSSDGWVAVGGPSVFAYRDDEYDVITLDESRDAKAPRDALGVFAFSSNRFFVVGESIELGDPDAISSVRRSPIEACDVSGCVLEAVAYPPSGSASEVTALHDVWGHDPGSLFAVGDGVILQRAIK